MPHRGRLTRKTVRLYRKNSIGGNSDRGAAGCAPPT
jgi:hypothetical protein